MGFEKKCLFEIPDITALHFQCKHCGAETVLRIGKLPSSSWPTIVTSPCPHCNTQSGIRADTSEGHAFMTFIEALGKIAQVTNGRNLKLMLEVECPQ